MTKKTQSALTMLLAIVLCWSAKDSIGDNNALPSARRNVSSFTRPGFARPGFLYSDF